MDLPRTASLDDFIPIAFLVIWALSALGGKRKKKSGRTRPPESRPPPLPPKRQVQTSPPLDEILRQVERELGLERLPPTQPAAPKKQSPQESQRTLSETAPAPGWHEQSGSQTTPSTGEHAMGYESGGREPGARRARIKKRAGQKVFKKRSRLIGSLVRDLRGAGLARGFLMAEILGPPLALRQDEDRHC